MGYTIAHPGGTHHADWKQIKVDGTDLAFRDPSGAALSLSSDCRRTDAPIGVLARQLIIGTSRDELLAASPVELAGDPGFSQTFDTIEDEVRVRIKAVTLLNGGCVFDFVAAVRDLATFDRVETVFDRWWKSFVRSPGDAASEVGLAQVRGS
jgi:hypothetical protein